MTTYIVAPGGALGGGSVTPNCTAGSRASTITWATPAPVTAGTALSAIQLNATANVAGTFAYTPPAGTVMSVAGTQTLSTTFTPTDTVQDTTATRAVTLQVNAAPSAFVGPANGGGWSGTISGTNLIYNGVAYPILNGRVNFPDCTTYIVAPGGALGRRGDAQLRGQPVGSHVGREDCRDEVGPQSSGASISAFDAAYDVGSGRYLVAGYWGNAVWGQNTGRDGVLVGSPFVIAPVGAYQPRVAANGNGVFLVVYTAVYGSTYSLEMRLVEVTPAPGRPQPGFSPAVVIKAGEDYALTYRTGLGWYPSCSSSWSRGRRGSAAGLACGSPG